MAIYDCFLFYNELDLLKIRLEQYYNIVDHFVIVECNKTTQGKEKNYIFEKNINLFKKYQDKIIYIKAEFTSTINKFINNNLDWSIEKFQRNCILRGLINCSLDDIIIISDLDEFIKPSILKNINNIDIININRLKGLKQSLRQFLRLASLNKKLLNRNIASTFLKFSPIAVELQPCPFYMNALEDFKWYGPIITTFQQLQIPETLRVQRYSLPYISNGGYHFSYLGGKEKTFEKLHAITEGSKIFQRPDFISITSSFPKNISDDEKLKKYIDICLNNKIDIWNPKRKFVIRDSISEIELTDIENIVHDYPIFFLNER